MSIYRLDVEPNGTSWRARLEIGSRIWRASGHSEYEAIELVKLLAGPDIAIVMDVMSRAGEDRFRETTEG